MNERAAHQSSAQVSSHVGVRAVRLGQDARPRGAARSLFTDERGSAPVEWTLVAGLLTLLLLSVLQVGFALHVRTTVIDAAAEGARAASLDGAALSDGQLRTHELIDAALNASYGDDIRVSSDGVMVTVTVRTPLPVLGLVGLPGAMEVTSNAPLERR